MKCYAVLFYTNRQKENSWKLHQVYESKQDAIDFCYTLPAFVKEFDYFVDPLGTIVFTTTCGMSSPLEMKNLNEAELLKYQQQYDMYKSESMPFDGLSWNNPKCCVMEVDFFKESEFSKQQKKSG
jgi:hypothetical protein